MKKFLKGLLSLALAFAMCAGVGACFIPVDENAVNLMAISANDVGVVDCDYYVVAEPAASVKVGAIEGLKNVGSLQELYDNEKGYTQAVIVAKNSVLQENFGTIRAFLGAVADNKEWLMNEETQITDVITAISNHLPDGATPTFNANTLTREVIANCGINFSLANDCKQAFKDFIAKAKVVNENMVGEVSDEFFADFSGEDDTSTPVAKEYSVFMPDGAPALALAQLMSTNANFGDSTFNYNVVAASTIQTKVTGETPEADICVLPSNLASKLLGNGQKYKMLGTVTTGNLFLLSKNGTLVNSINLSNLRGKTVGVVNLPAVPGLVFKIILNGKNIAYKEVTAGIES